MTLVDAVLAFMLGGAILVGAIAVVVSFADMIRGARRSGLQVPEGKHRCRERRK